ncbi:hypothetical protein ABK040_006928 [Willaertia magna]
MFEEDDGKKTSISIPNNNNNDGGLVTEFNYDTEVYNSSVDEINNNNNNRIFISINYETEDNNNNEQVNNDIIMSWKDYINPLFGMEEDLTKELFYQYNRPTNKDFIVISNPLFGRGIFIEEEQEEENDMCADNKKTEQEDEENQEQQEKINSEEYLDWIDRFEVGVDMNDGAELSSLFDLNDMKTKDGKKKSKRFTLSSIFVNAFSIARPPAISTEVDYLDDMMIANNRKHRNNLSPRNNVNNNNNLLEVIKDNPMLVQRYSDADSSDGANNIFESFSNNKGGSQYRNFKELVNRKKRLTTNESELRKQEEEHHQQPIMIFILDYLPEEILKYILTFLPFEEMLNCRLINVTFCQMLDDDMFWRSRCKEYGLDIESISFKRLKRFYIENQIKITIVGEEQVGKSLLIRRCCNNPFYILESFVCGKKQYDYYCEMDSEPYYIYFKEINKEILPSITKLESSNEDIFWVCFSILDHRSLRRCKKWIKTIRTKCPNNPIMLLGLKVDLRREEGADEVKLIAKGKGEEYKMKYKLFSYNEVSNKTREGINNILEESILAKRLVIDNFYDYDKLFATEKEVESEDPFLSSDEDEEDIQSPSSPQLVMIEDNIKLLDNDDSLSCPNYDIGSFDENSHKSSED